MKADAAEKNERVISEVKELAHNAPPLLWNILFYLRLPWNHETVHSENTVYFTN